MFAFDTETTGTDLFHEARPFFVTICRESGQQTFYEWAVDPMTRKVTVPTEDLQAIYAVLNSDEQRVLHNAKFDAHAMTALGHSDRWRWELCEDTLPASHVLASNQRHDLTSLVLQYLTTDIKPYEDRLEKAVKECRSMVQQARLKDKRERKKGAKGLMDEADEIAYWKIAGEDVDGMPSATKETWRFDYWLPKAMAKHLKYPGGHPYHTVLRDYANCDSAATLALWTVLEKELKRRGLWNHYRSRLAIIPVLWNMERQRLTVMEDELTSLTRHYKEESAKDAERCVAIAKSRGYDLELPNGSRNKSLFDFCFSVLKLPAYEYGKSGPCMDANTRARWENEVEGEGLEFLQALSHKAKKDTQISYLEGYKRYALRIGESNFRPVGRSREAGRLHRQQRGRGGVQGPSLPLENQGCGERGTLSAATRGYLVLHPSVNSTGTATTRFSSSNPNAQNISTKEDEGKGIRHVFGPLPGREWWSIDATNIELRIPAYEANEKEMIALFEKPDLAPFYGAVHLLNFSTVFPEIWDQGVKEVGWEKVGEWCKTTHKQKYKRVKNGGFAIQYGAVDKDGGTADTALGYIGAQRKIRERFRGIHGPGGLNERWCRFADQYGYVETLPNRTIDPKRGYPLMTTRTEYGKVLPTVPLSYHVQGTAGEWMGCAMVKVAPQLEIWNTGMEPGTGYYIILTVHDQLVLDFPAGTGDNPALTNWPKIKRLKEIMESVGMDLVPQIPTPCSVTYHPHSWGEEVSFHA